ncbi:hypothetical protein PPYR_05025 [Photinus pyralis]|uniref:Replication factor C subunit 3 n=1 Tax=Photinus pyralis TaxID=7054 RepID=A0A1Y1KNS7_PHOPY|nr:replication factor C subunit 3 [Photinus pyralis]KAB0802839.1 hypothetical protein PPYR_05025 [Photinus pyralis]
MSLWVDKYRPKDLSKLDYHKEQAENLKKLTHKGDFPHLLIYGPSGAGKKTRIMCILKDLYGSGVERLRMEQLNFTTPSKKKLEIMTVSSNYHIEINPSDVGMYDRIVVMDLIKNVAQTQQLDVNGQREFKIIVLTDVDNLTRDAQHALRRTMEKYIANCRLILCANSTSRLTPAIRSRCLGIRVAAPTVPEICCILQTICKKEGLTIRSEFAQKIAEKSNRNLRRAILMCEACKVEQYPFAPNQNIAEPDWLMFIRAMARKISHEQSVNTLASVRGDLYELIIHGIPNNIIFQTMVSELVKNCDISLKAEIISQAALFEHRLQHGNKAIFHFEAFVAKFMCLYKRFLEDAVADVF